MKRKNLLKVGLLAAGLLMGSNVWADDYYTTSTADGVNTTTMYFNLFSGTVGRTNSVATTLTSDEITTSQNQKVYPVKDYSAFKMFNYIAMADKYGIRHGSSTTITTTSTSDGIFCAAKNTYYVSIINLHVGDKVTITASNGVTVRSGNATYDVDGTATNTTTGEGDAVTYANANVGELTITSGTQLDLQMGRDTQNNLSIGSIKIVSKYDAVTTPSMEQTAAGTISTIRITAGVSNNTSATVTTYYTTDGTTPSASNYEGSFTTATHDVNITSNKTIKAVSVTSGEYGGSSFVVSGDYTAEEATLNAPVISQTAMTLSGGAYHRTYSFISDQSGVAGYDSQALTYSYTLDGGEAVEATSVIATTSGKLVVTVSATGFKSNSTEIDIDGAGYIKTYTFNATTDITKNDGAETVANSSTINGTGCNYYNLAQCTYSTRRSIAFTGFAFAWAITNNIPYSLAARTGSGSK